MSNYIYSADYNSDYEPPAPTIEIGISLAKYDRPALTFNALIDTGSDGTMLPFELLESIGAKPVGKARIRGILGNSRSVNIYLVKLYIGLHQIYAIRVAGVDTQDEPLIGRNVIRHLVITLNGLAGITEIAV